MVRLRLMFTIVLASAAGIASARPATPLDQARHGKTLAITRDQLAEAVARKDLAVIASYIAADAKVGTGIGMPALEAWLRRDPALSEELDRALALGGRMMRPGQFEAPYTQFVREQGIPLEELGVVIGRNIAVHEAPTETAQVMARYTHETAVVKRWWVADAHGRSAKAEAGPPNTWVEIQLPSKRRGYVLKRWVRWVGALRVGFAKRGGQWWAVRIEAGN